MRFPASSIFVSPTSGPLTRSGKGEGPHSLLSQRITAERFAATCVTLTAISSRLGKPLFSKPEHVLSKQEEFCPNPYLDQQHDFSRRFALGNSPVCFCCLS